MGGQLRVDDGTVDMNALSNMEWKPAVTISEASTSEYPQPFHENGSHIAETCRASTSPLSLYFYFFLKVL